jgi:outer membrane receptor protein involved in Fe transport
MQIPSVRPSPGTVRRWAYLIPLFATAAATAQTAPAAAPTSTQPPADRAVVLNPFEVRTDKDTSYGALNSNSISAFNMELLKAPVAADIFTEQFMQDVATTNVEDLLNNYGAGVGQVLATPDSDSNNNQPGDRFSVAQVGSRGLTAGVTRRDGFIASSTRTSVNDTFDTERVEVIKGANAAPAAPAASPTRSRRPRSSAPTASPTAPAAPRCGSTRPAPSATSSTPTTG